MSSLVILEADSTKGLLWELENVKSTIHPYRVVISFLSKQNAPDVQTTYLESSQTSFKKFYMNYSKHFGAIFGQALPDFNENTCFLIFDENWNPHPIQIRITKEKGLFNRKRVKKRYNALQINNLFRDSIERVAKIESLEQ